MLKTLLAYAASRVRPLMLLLPPVFGVLVACVAMPGWLGDPDALEAPVEKASRAVLVAALAIAVLRYVASRRPFFAWVAALSAALLGREIHFAGSTAILYLALAALLWVAWRCYADLREHLNGPGVPTMLAMIFMTYALTKTLDQNWWKLVPGEGTWERPVEEFMELLGHVLTGLLVLTARRTRSPRLSRGSNRG